MLASATTGQLALIDMKSKKLTDDELIAAAMPKWHSDEYLAYLREVMAIELSSNYIAYLDKPNPKGRKALAEFLRRSQ